MSKGGKVPPYSLVLVLFEIIWNAEDKSYEFDNPDPKKRSIRYNQIVKYSFTQPNLIT